MNKIETTRRAFIGGIGALMVAGPAIADELVNYQGPITKIITPIPAAGSALDNVNVRRLLNTIEKSISEAMQYQVFEPNDSFTRSQVKLMADEYLQGLQQQRELYQYLAVCDETNNHLNLIDNRELALDVYIQPSHIPSYIIVNFKTTSTSTNWEEMENVRHIS